MKNDTLRAFIALDFPADAVSFFSEQQKRLKPWFKDARITWVNPSNIHITLAFLGNIRRDSISHITKILTELDGKKSFVLAASQIGFFPAKGNPKVLWIGFKESPLIENLQSQILSRLKAIGLNTDDKKFIPHATLARLREWPSYQRERQNVINQFMGETVWNMPTLTLYESILLRHGAQYKPLFQIHLL